MSVACWLLLIGADAVAQTVTVPAGATWSYLDTGVDPGPSWALPGFDDTPWATGPARLGYGSGIEATTVSWGPDAADKYVTTWLRHTFTVADASLVNRLDLRLQRDDGVIVYLNGVEQLRDNLPLGAILTNTLASAPVDGAAETTWYPYVLPADDLLTGDNTLAVAVHQVAPDSPDLGFDLELVTSDAGVLVRGPYLNLNTSDGVTIKWRTATPTDSVVEIGAAPGALAVAATDPTPTTEHAVRLTGLPADTLFHYAVGSTGGRQAGDDGAHTFRTAPVPGTDRPSRFWVVGDSGTANANARAVRDAFLGYTGATDPDLFVMLGDNAYGIGTDLEYQAAVFDMYPTTLRKVPVWSTLGNHDGASADSLTMTGPYYDIFTFPRAGEAGGVPSGTEAYYSFDYANVHFVCLDSHETNRSPVGAMLTWLEADLLATTQEWIVAFWHHPPYSKGSHNSDTEFAMVEMRSYALPILEAYGVDLVLSGHSHSYERSWLIDGHYGASDSFDPQQHAWDLGDGDPAGDGAFAKSPAPAPHEGAVYVVAGSSGQVSGGSLDHEAMFVSMSLLGSLVLDVDGPRLDAAFLDASGTVRDRFSIRKDTGCPDADADGVCSVDDGCRLVFDPLQEDADLDLVGDACDPCPQDPLDDADADGHCADLDDCPVDYDPLQEDADADGVGDACDPCPLDPLDDVDGDGWCADEDGCPFDADPLQQDADGDGIGDVCDPCWDVDGDGACDPVDTCPGLYDPSQNDRDGDGAGDLCDPCVADPDDDADADGRCADVDNCPAVANPGQDDGDFDGIGDPCDACPVDPLNDWDADGLCGELDNCPFAANADQADGDLDGAGDACDVCLDVDEDLVCDPVDNCPIPNPAQGDADGDGLGDVCDPCTLDPLDDLDGDGRCGEVDNCPFVANPTQDDADGDGTGDACDLCPDVDADGACDPVDNCPVANADQADADADGSGDVCDPCPLDPFDDLDGDAVCADVDNCPFTTNPTQDDTNGDGEGDACQPGCPDADADTVCDAADNCPVANLDQADADGDGTGDACDPCPADRFDDLDGDGRCAEVDNCPFAANPTQEDADGDGTGDACDLCPDLDADGACDPVDNCPGVANPTQDDTDGDGTGDACQPGCADADADTVCDDADNCPVANLDQADEDGDGTGDACDPCPADRFDDLDGDGRCAEVDNCPFAANPTQDDTDADGTGDACDLCPDVDADGACDPVDNCPGVANPTQDDTDGDGTGDACQPACADADADTVCDDADNCPVANPTQADADGDGTGDPCDPCPLDPFDDLDGDARCAEVDNCPFAANPTQDDADADGTGDACDLCPDVDADLACDPVDTCPGLADPLQADGDGDGAGDACDPCPVDPFDDLDGDGACADVDNCPFDTNPTQADVDADGAGDACDPDPVDEPEPPVDTGPTGAGGDDEKACGCGTSGPGPSVGWLLLVLPLARRRR